MSELVTRVDNQGIATPQCDITHPTVYAALR